MVQSKNRELMRIGTISCTLILNENKVIVKAIIIFLKIENIPYNFDIVFS